MNTASLERAEIGSPVVVDQGRFGRSVRLLRTVTKVNARKVTLDDGSEWTRRGRKWGATTDRWMTGPRAALVTDLASVQAEIHAERQAAALSELRRTLGNRADHEIPTLDGKSCAAIIAILDAAKAAPPDEVEEQVKSVHTDLEPSSVSRREG